MSIRAHALCSMLLLHAPISAPSDTSLGGPKVSGWLRARYASSSDVDVDTAAPGDQDLGGFNLDNARLIVSGDAWDGFTYTISVEGGDPAVIDASSGSGIGLLDAYAGVRIGDFATASIGRFSSTVLWRTAIEERKLLFLDRSFLGEVWDGRDVGVELTGRLGKLDWWAAAQNGADSTADDLALSACVAFHILGDSLDLEEGVLELGDAHHLTASACWYDDQSFSDGTAVGGGLHYARGRLGIDAEIVDHDDDIRPAPAMNRATGAVIPTVYAATGVDTPWDATVSWLLVRDRWEVAARWQDLDDAAETTVGSVAVNRYVRGHDVKWTVQFDSSKSDDATLGADVLSAGLTVGF
jgi:hypothetical protein